MNRFRVVLDACVLYPAPVRDLLLELTLAGLYQAHWTDEIHDEWLRNVLKNRPDLEPKSLIRTRELVDLHAEAARVEHYQPLIAGLELPDPDDRHVLAAAIRCHADAIVTFNLKDFPDAALEPWGIEAIHPDDFVTYQFDLNVPKVCAAAKTIRQRLRSPPRSAREYVDRLRTCCRALRIATRAVYRCSEAQSRVPHRGRRLVPFSWRRTVDTAHSAAVCVHNHGAAHGNLAFTVYVSSARYPANHVDCC